MSHEHTLFKRDFLERSGPLLVQFLRGNVKLLWRTWISNECTIRLDTHSLSEEVRYFSMSPQTILFFLVADDVLYLIFVNCLGRHD